jgi:hypothetical protein
MHIAFPCLVCRPEPGLVDDRAMAGVKRSAELTATTTPSKKASTASRPRSRAPVFVLGSVRSGTTLLYHMLLSAGGFAVYRSESHTFNVLEPRFGDLSVLKNRERLMQAWLDSKLFQVSGLEADAIRTKVLAECRTGGDFLRIVMEEIARAQQVERWAECTPEHILFLPRIKQTIPDALIVHVIRDGRDAALSLEKQNWVRRLPWDRSRPLFAAGAYWEWMVRKGREEGHKLGNDYCEVRFERLIADPHGTLADLGSFIEHDLDYDRILRNGIGSVREPNSSFANDASSKISPVGRWKNLLTKQDLATLEAVIGNTLQEFGYAPSTQDVASEPPSLKQLRASYLAYFNLKLWLKSRTPLGRVFVTKDLSWL